MNRFLRTGSTRRVLAVIAGVMVAIAAGTTIAIAASGGGPVPRAARLANAIRGALSPHQIPGISADITFTNHLINASQIQGPTDPLLAGGSGHLWVSSDGQLRIELYGDNGDPAVVLNQHSWWVSDPMTQTVYEGGMPKSLSASDTGGSDKAKKSAGSAGSIPTISQIQTELNHLATHLNISGARPTDVAGQPAYTVTVSPKHDGGLLGNVQLAWDAIRGVPLNFAIYARGNSTPVLGIEATGVTYGPVSPSIFSISPPAGYHVVKVSTPAGNGTDQTGARTTGKGKKGKGRHAHTTVSGVAAVAKHLSFHLVAPSKLVGLPRQSATLLDWGGHPAALLTYGQGLGGIAVIEQVASGSGSQSLHLRTGSGENATGLALPGVRIGAASGQELDTALGTIVRFTRGGVTYTVIGSVVPYAADAAARAL
jgi:outer membrane lipoprotein-sorting protein